MIKTYFKTIQELTEYLTVDISSDLDVILPYLKQAEKYAIEIIGETQHSDLISYLNTEPVPTADEKLDLLISKVRPVVANFGYYLAVPKLNINVGNTGFTITTGSNLEPASQWRVDEFRKSVELSGYDAQEELISFLEKNKSDYPSWASSSAYSFNKKLFVNNADEFYDITFRQITRLDFLKLKPFILQLENSEIKGSISKPLFDELKLQFKENNLTTLNNTLLTDYIKPTICYLSFNKLIADETFQTEGLRLIKDLRNYLNSNADNYPLYKNSTLYEEIISEDFNSQDSGIFVF